MKNLHTKGIRFSGDSIKGCICFVDLVNSTKNTIAMDGLEYIRKYYSTFINSISDIVKSNNGRIIKNIGDCLLIYFPKTSDPNSTIAFREVIECGLKILEARYTVNQELSKQHLPPFNYRISMDYGMLDIALVGDYSQIDLFGPTLNLCSKINTALSVPNHIVIGDNFYNVLKSFNSILITYDIKLDGEYKITEDAKYPIYSIKRKNNTCVINDHTNWSSDSVSTTKNNEITNDISLFKGNQNKNKKIILVDDEEDILFTYTSFLKDYDYQINCFTDPLIALDHIQKISNFDDLLIILDIRMKKLNGLQLYQQINSIDSTIKIIFITALDILDEFLSIFPTTSKTQIMRKPIDKVLFTSMVKKLLC